MRTPQADSLDLARCLGCRRDYFGAKEANFGTRITQATLEQIFGQIG